MPTFDRSNAMLEIVASPMQPGDLIPINVVAEEGISRPFTYNVRVLSETGQIAADTMLDQPVCLVLRSSGDPVRHFHGIVQQFAARLPNEYGLFAYDMTLVPKFWFLGQTVDCRVYQNKSTVDILTAMLADAGVDSKDFRITGDKPVREYTTQYNETDLVFATRLMEEEGYFYFFEHSEQGHKLVIANANTGFFTIPDATLRYAANSDEPDTINTWTYLNQTVHGEVKLKDHDPTAPTKQLEKDQTTTLTASGASARDSFTWPAYSTETAEVEARSKRRMEAAEAWAAAYQGRTNFPGLTPGGKFTLAHDPLTGADNLVLAVLEVRHFIEDTSALNDGKPASYYAGVRACVNSLPWRQPPTVLRPRMEGVHSAVVLGADGDEISYDEFARVKILFRWDYRAEATDALSVWARVIQPWAGNGWGTQFMPRVGSEVAVAFINGDPDQPVVLGGMYNGSDAPIFNKDSDKTKTGWRSRSSTGGAAADFNEFTFDDKAGAEKVFLHAQFDFLTEVEHDQTLKVDNCRIVNVKVDETMTIGGKQTETIEKDRAITISSGNDLLQVKTGNLATKVDTGNVTLDVKLGNISSKAAAGAISLEAVQSIELKVGSNSIKIDPSGITIKGTMVQIEGTAMAQMKAPMTTVKGDGMLTLKGGVAMIN